MIICINSVIHHATILKMKVSRYSDRSKPIKLPACGWKEKYGNFQSQLLGIFIKHLHQDRKTATQLILA